MSKLTIALFVSILVLPPAIAADSPSFADRQQPILHLMQVEEGWKITRGGAGCTVGVIDSGFDFFHPAFDGSLQPGWFAPGFYHTDFYSMDAHGTLVASLIAARRKEGHDGMWGLAPGCKVLGAAQGMPVQEMARWQNRFWAANPKATPDDMQTAMRDHLPELTAWGDRWLEYVFGTMADAIRYLADQGVRVINLSEYAGTGGSSASPS